MKKGKGKEKEKGHKRSTIDKSNAMHDITRYIARNVLVGPL